MEHRKSLIKDLLIQGKLKEANEAARAYAEYCQLTEMLNAFVLLGGRINDYEEKWETGQISYEEASRTHAQISHGLVQWVDRLPDNPIPAGRKKKPLEEARFKKRIFYWLIAVKVLVFLRLAYHWSTGGFNNDQFQATATLLLPAFAAYISVMLDFYIRQQQAGVQPPKYISGPLVTFSYWLFPIYAVALIFCIELKAMTRISFSQMNFWLAMAESVLGGYVGRLVFAFFKKE